MKNESLSRTGRSLYSRERHLRLSQILAQRDDLRMELLARRAQHREREGARVVGGEVRRGGRRGVEGVVQWLEDAGDVR